VLRTGHPKSGKRRGGQRFVKMSDDREKRLRRIDEATNDWLESQVFPKTPLIFQGGPFQHKNRSKIQLEQATEIEKGFPLFSTDRMAA
jgi:hypothetical protein